MPGDVMKAVVLERAREIVEKSVPVPRPEPGAALVRIIAATLCGSDIHAYKGNSLLLTYPRVLGHELCGEVAEANDCRTLKKGDRVVVLPYFSCGTCYACSLGRENCCSTLKVMGVHIEGGIAEYVAVPERFLIPVPAGMDPIAGALVEPLAVGAHSIRRGDVSPGDKVLVVGAGPIGLAAAEFARIAGAEVVMADVDARRSAFVGENFGYEILDPADRDGMKKRLSEWTGGVMPNRVVDSTGHKGSMSASIDHLSQAGNLVFVGLQGGTVDLSDPAIHVREATVFASRVAQKRDFLSVIDAVLGGRTDASRQITHRAPFSAAKEAIDSWVADGPAVFKGAILFE